MFLNKYGKFFLKYSTGVFFFSIFPTVADEALLLDVNEPLSFKKAISTAKKNDPWLAGNIHQQRAIELMSEAVNSLPAPKVSINIANLPTNGFDFYQEGMTQANIGMSQIFPRGDTLAIKSEQLKLESEGLPFQRQDREAKITVTVGGLWLDAYRVQESIALIEKNRTLFEQLTDAAEASYSSTYSKTRQQDIVQAQLELTRLEDRLNILGQQQNKFEGMLLQWLTTFSLENTSNKGIYQERTLAHHHFNISKKLPAIALVNANLILADKWLQPQILSKYITNHPSLLAIEKNISATKTNIKLAEQKYKPEWGISANYGYRADDLMGNSRADLFSVGVTFDLPFFTENRQDSEVKSAISKTESIKTEKLLLIKQLLGTYSSAKGRLLRLKDRQYLYKNRLLPQTYEQVEASLAAYANNRGSFSEVVRARIAIVNAEIDQLTLNVEEQKLILTLNYLFVGSNHQTKIGEFKKNHLTTSSSNSLYAVHPGEYNEIK